MFKKNLVDWMDWKKEAFKIANREKKIVLAILYAKWSGECISFLHVLEKNQRARAMIKEYFVPVLVDIEDNPDVAMRYLLGDIPAVYFLTSNAVMMHSMYNPSIDEVIDIMNKITSIFKENISEIRHKEKKQLDEMNQLFERPIEFDKLSHEIQDTITGELLNIYDELHGGFGKGFKFLHPYILDYLASWYLVHPNNLIKNMIISTVDSLISSGMFDKKLNVFYYFSRKNDWSEISRVINVADNVQMLKVLKKISLLFPDELDLTSILEGLKNNVNSLFKVPDSQFFYPFISLNFDEKLHELLDEKIYKISGTMVLEQVFYTDVNMKIASELAEFAFINGDMELLELAKKTAQFVKRFMSAKNGLMYHSYADKHNRFDLLQDQSWTLNALVTLSQFSFDSFWIESATELAKIIQKTFQDFSNKGLNDVMEKRNPLGYMKYPYKSILDNSLVAENLIKIGWITGRIKEWKKQARDILYHFSKKFVEFSFHSCWYSRALDWYLNDPRLVVLVGGNGETLELLFNKLKNIVHPRMLIIPVNTQINTHYLDKFNINVRKDPKIVISNGKSWYRIHSLDDKNLLTKLRKFMDATKKPPIK